ncbi:MAG TPA: tryptophanase [Bacillota bacterium]|jgi:tryptophanase|nr:tryptophanase [Bacillota bacterium]HOK71647.1 tryptophanase [Bacillota bacterium]HOL52508.1 tryptophanase [Bacillota bacterium]HOO31389.1 tryptophanase [Bacillota bacterium]HPQ02573.1 tryptophanase [Bacillota bacterium]
MRPRDEYAEPYRVKMVEPIKMTTREERIGKIEGAGYNVFNLRAEDVYIDLLTDSGTPAMSDTQWAALMCGDEAYAGSKSFYRFRDVVRNITGYEYVIPAHQGRGAEHVIMTALVKDGDAVLGNMHFDTTMGHILLRGAEPVNLLKKEGYEVESTEPFKGNIDIEALERELDKRGSEKVPFVLMTVTCNSNGGQPVSMENIKAASEIAHKHNVPLFFDCARFAENSWFIKNREPGYENKSLLEIAQEMFSYGDGCIMSAKKDALVNIGGFAAVRDPDIYHKAIEWEIPFEGYLTYGGLAGRDLEAMAQGLSEVLDDDYLEDRIGQVAYLADLLLERGVPVITPAGGHGVYVDAKAVLPHIPQSEFPAQAMTVELYIEGGVRGVELGACAFARTDPATGETIYPELELVRLAIPRRVYTDRHMLQVARAFEGILERRSSIRGLRITYEAPVLRHFTAEFERV